MTIKDKLKKLFGKNSYKFRLKNILGLLFGKKFFLIRAKFKLFLKRFDFLHLNLEKKIEHQRIVQKEEGLIIDLTKDNYLTYHLRPKKAQNFYLESTCAIDEKIGIIIQGPIGNMFNFLKETIEIYNKIFKNSFIIISTWESEDQLKINTLRKENVHIIYNKEPADSILNIDHQIYSTNSGLVYAKENNLKFILKTRPDIRINKNNLETYLLSLLKTFPLKEENNLINSRIIVPSLTTFKYRLYGLTDIVMFGHINDLLIYFDKKNFIESLSDFKINKNNLLINETPVVAEIFLCSRYLKKLKGDLEWTLDDWWKCLEKYFCVVDNSSLDVFWNKYDWNYEYRYIRTYSDKFARSVDFQDWLSLYSKYENNWKLACNDHERYNENRQLINLFKD